MIFHSRIYSSNIGKFYTYPYLFTEVYTFLTNRKLLFILSRLIPISMSKASLYSYAEKSFYVLSSPKKRETGCNFTGCQMPHFMIVLILYINLFNLSRIRKKMSIFEEYEAFNANSVDLIRGRVYAESGLGLHCFPVPHFYETLGINGLMSKFRITDCSLIKDYDSSTADTSVILTRKTKTLTIHSLWPNVFV